VRRLLVFVLILVLFLRAAGRRSSGAAQPDGATKTLEFDFGLAGAERVRGTSAAANLSDRFGRKVALELAVVGANRERCARILRDYEGNVAVVGDEAVLSAA
jgi:hypothetical protein